ncbi:MAG: hypothetical protein FRX48_06118 [Lasallia pustulata]|uniref:Killer toxin Kp4 domain-containing protein n=1 Tax=Lasallia pustulata TaxID=136370 RepID=A0A5M8PMG8_9LECA|nr:MAG: hypothetical protein FRX48_06118 [Lasallia pustulata]
MRPVTSPFSVPLLLLLLLPTLALSLGINCRGSFNCNPTLSFRHAYPYIPTFAALLANGTSPSGSGDKRLTGGPLPRNIYYSVDNLDEPNIACVTIAHAGGGFCVFLQGNVPNEGILGEVVVERMGDLVAHGCQECGSVPLSGDNNPNEEGILTVNWSTYTLGCNGVCEYGNTS